MTEPVAADHPATAKAVEALDVARVFVNEYAIPFAIKLAVALAIFVIGRIVIRFVGRTLDRVMERGKVDVSLRKFLGDIARAGMLVAVVLASLDTLGIKTTALVAILGAAGLAVGLALQGSLSNFAAGVMLIVLRPYKVGDWVNLSKYVGRVDAVRVFSTVIITGDNREISIPNGQIINQPIENLTVLGRRRFDVAVTILVTPNATIPAVRELLAKALAEDARIEQGAAIDLVEASDGAFKLVLRSWTTTDQQSAVTAATIERVRVALLAAQLRFSVTVLAAA